MLKELCASCLRPVYPMERLVIDNVCVHRSCFCCQVCGRKLSLQNYADLHGMFYCQVHYKQMAGAKSRSEVERLEHQLDHQVQRMAMAGKRPQPPDWYNRAKKKTEVREKPTPFNAECSLQLAEHRQELNSRSVLLGNKLRTGWPPSETALLPLNGKAGNGACSWKKPASSLQTSQVEGGRAGRMMLRAEEGKSIAETAVDTGRFSPGVTYTKERQQVFSWPKIIELRDSENISDGVMPRGKQGGKVSQRVAAIQQGKAQLKRGSASTSSPLVLKPVKSLPRGSLLVHQATRQSTKPTNWMYLRGTEGHDLSATELPMKKNKVYGSLTTLNEGGTVQAMTDDNPELTIGTTDSAEDKHHLGETMNNSKLICYPEEPKTRNITSKELKCGAEGADPPEYEAEAHCLSGVSGTPYVSSGSLEPRGLSVSPETTELENEKSKADSGEFPGKQIPAASGEDIQPSSTSYLPGIESKGTENAKELEPTSSSRFLGKPSPEHASQENKAEKNRVSSLVLTEMTECHNVSYLQKPEPQARSDQLLTNTQEDVLRHDVESSSKDFPVKADTSMKETCTTWPHKSKDPGEVLRGNIFYTSEQPAKKLDSSKPGKPGGDPVSGEKVDLKLPDESTMHMSAPGAQSKETRSSQACREKLGKGFQLGKNSFTTLLGSEVKGSTLKKETTTQRKATKPQSALATLFGHSSEKKQSHQENPAIPSELRKNEEGQQKPQGLLSSSSQAKQKASKNDQQPGKKAVTSKDTQESSVNCSDPTEGKEICVLLLGSGASISCDDQHKRTELAIHNQRALNSRVQQQQDSHWPSLMSAQENQKEDTVTSEDEINPLPPPPEFMPAADNSKSLVREENHHNAHLPEIQNLLSLDVEDTAIEGGVFFSPINSEKLSKKAEIQLDNVDFLEDNNLLFSGGQDYLSVASKTSNSDLQNSEAGTPPCLGPNPSELFQEIPAETNAPLVQWDTSSLSFLAGRDEINVRDPEEIQSCALLQQMDPQCQAPEAVGDTFRFSAEGSTNKYLITQEDNFPPISMFTPHASETFKQDVFDPFNVDSAKVDQKATENMNRSGKPSGFEEDYESLSSADLNVLNGSLLDQEFFI